MPNALSRIVRGDSPIEITNASLGYGPQGALQGNLGGHQGYFDRNGDFLAQTPSGEWVRTGANQLSQWFNEGQAMRHQQELANRMEEAKVREAEGKAQEAMSSVGGVKPTFNAEAGGYVYPPSAENPQGKFVPVSGFQKPDKPLTEYQGQSVMFGTRAADAHNLLNSMEDKINTPGLKTAQFLEGVPLIGSAAHAMLTPEQQQVDQAQRNFVNAVMRRESGATISNAEFDNAKRQYFPQAGDSPAVIEQKRRNRDMVIQGFARGAGPGGKDIQEVAQTNPYIQAKPSGAHPQDLQAIQWAKSNPNDPRSAQILKANGY